MVLTVLNFIDWCKRRVLNVLNLVKQKVILEALVKGKSMRSPEHMTNTHRDPIMR
jgi:hypothetical protein